MGRKRTQLTQEQVKAALVYDPETGLFFKKMPASRRHPAPRLVLLGYIDRKGYIRIGVAGENHPAHRIAWLYMTGAWPADQIDHINGVKPDNRWANLREADNSQNQANIPARKNNPVGLKGAHRAAEGRWSSRITIRGERYFLGLFDTPEEAHSAYRGAVAKLNPEFGRAV